MAQEQLGGEKIWKRDPLHDVKEELLGSPRLKHVDRNEKLPEDVQLDDLVKSEVPAAFVDELKNDPFITEGAHSLSGSTSGFLAQDPLHDVKQELDPGIPPLKHVDIAGTQEVGKNDDAGIVLVSQVPKAFEDELMNDHSIVGDPGDIVSNREVNAEEADTVRHLIPGSRGKLHPERGIPHFRISAHPGMQTGGQPSRDITNDVSEKQGGVEDVEKMDMSPPVDGVTLGNRPSSTRGTPLHGMSPHRGIRTGGLTKDLKPEAAESGSVETAIADLSNESNYNKAPGLHRVSCRGGATVPRRGGLARTGSGVQGEYLKGPGSLARMASGVPGEGKAGGLARTGSGVPGNSLARTGSGIPGNSLARSGSGIPGSGLFRSGSGVPNIGGNDLKDFSSFLDAAGGVSSFGNESEPATDPMICERKSDSAHGSVGGGLRKDVPATKEFVPILP